MEGARGDLAEKFEVMVKLAQMAWLIWHSKPYPSNVLSKVYEMLE